MTGNTPNFASILNKQVSTVEPPQLLPVADYILRITKIENTTSTQKKTPGAKFNYAVEGLAPGNSVDLTDASGKPIDLAKKKISDTFWLTDDALPRLRKQLEEVLGLDVSTRTFGEILNSDCNGRSVIATISQKPTQDGKGMFNEITGYAQLR